MRGDLLERGAALLEADAAKPDGVRFDLGFWVKEFTEHGPSDFAVAKKSDEIPLTCNTSACAMGLFCLSGAFKDAGLTYQYHPGYGDFLTLIPSLGEDDRRGDGIAVAADLFDIDYEAAEVLFMPDSYRKTKGAVAELEVAKRMRELAAGQDILHYHETYYDEDNDENDDT
jgi:hypothetical protein